MEKWEEWPASQSYTTQSLTSFESFQTSAQWPRQLTPQQGICSTWWSKRESRLVSQGEEWSNQEKKIVSSIWENDLVQGSWQLSLHSLSEPQILYSPYVNLFCSTFLLPESSGCEWIFLCWSNWRVPVSLADSIFPWWKYSLLFFTARCYGGASFQLWCSGVV